MSNNLQERFQAMSLGEKIIIIAGPLLLIASFLPWYSIDLGPFGSFNRSGWQSPGAIWSILAVLCGLVMAGQIAAARFGSMQMPALPENVTWPRVHLGLGVAAALFIAIKLLNESSFLGFGFYIGIILVAALVVGAALMFQEEQKGGGAPTGGGPTGGPPATGGGPTGGPPATGGGPTGGPPTSS
jgi:hypothetical protein